MPSKRVFTLSVVCTICLISLLSLSGLGRYRTPTLRVGDNGQVTTPVNNIMEDIKPKPKVQEDSVVRLDDKELKRLHEIQKLRKETVRKTCEESELIYNDGVRGAGPWYEGLRVLPEQKVIVCLNHKVGSTYWRTMVQRFKYRNLDSYGHDARLRLIKNYTTVMFTRHPFERLMSAFNDRVVSMVPRFVELYGQKMQKFYPPGKGNPCLSDIDFETFVKFVIHRANADNHFNTHWAPYYRRCRPCFVDYDVIGTIETMKDDMKLLDSIVGFNRTEEYRRDDLEMSSKCRPFNEHKSMYHMQCADNDMALRSKVKGLERKGYIVSNINVTKTANYIKLWRGLCLKLVRSFLTPEGKVLVNKRKKKATQVAFKSLSSSLYQELAHLYHLDFRMFDYKAEDIFDNP